MNWGSTLPTPLPCNSNPACMHHRVYPTEPRVLYMPSGNQLNAHADVSENSIATAPCCMR